MSTGTQNQSITADGRRPEAIQHLSELARWTRSLILRATTRAGSGHPSSSLSATDLMIGLLFGGAFHYDIDDPHNPNNDRLIFSKGHASPLFYSLWAAAGGLSEEEVLSYRQFGSVMEGHPTPALRFVEAATGSLGQGLSIGVGLALNAKHLDKLPYRTYVLLGDSEMAEGSQWEAVEIAAHYQLDNLVGVLDVNRLGQRGETMHGHDLAAYQRRFEAFGWHTLLIDGHVMDQVVGAFHQATQITRRPTVIIARTLKGKGVAAIEDQGGWHGKALSEEELVKALAGLGKVDASIRGNIPKPDPLCPESPPAAEAKPLEPPSGSVATRAAYGTALKRLYPQFRDIVCLDGEVSNSTGAETFKEANPERFFEMFIAEQNMAGVALGLSRRGKIPFVSSFAAFLTRAFDQIRMSQYSDANVKFVGSHAGVSIGEDGPSQMGLEDIAMFRSILNSVVLHPCDAVATEKLVEEAARHVGIVYLRTMRQKTPVLYRPLDSFPIGGSKVLRENERDVATIVAAGATVHEALHAYDALQKEGLSVRVIDAYSIKPIDHETLRRAAAATGLVITAEDHYAEGGLGEAVLSALAEAPVPIHVLAVRRRPRSGKPEELRDFVAISSAAIASSVRELRGDHARASRGTEESAASLAGAGRHA
jgi:transketolase